MDFYEILKVSYCATPEEIKKAFHKLAMEYHPDANPNVTETKKEELNEMFAKINEAYNTLYDEKKRRRYDLTNNIAHKRQQEKRNMNSQKETRPVEPVNETTEEKTLFLDDYDMIKRYLDTNFFNILVGESKIYFKDDKPVAVCRDDIITMFFECDSRTIWNHNNRVMIGIAKNLPIVKNNQVKVCDCVMFRGMCGTPNTFIKKFLMFQLLITIKKKLKVSY